MAFEISCESDLWGAFEAGALAEAARRAVAAREPDMPREAEIALLLTDDREIAEINAQWRGLNKPTNVLSFPTTGPMRAVHLGDIIVAYETLAREARDEDKSLADHFTHLIVHGLLHLIDYDHIDPQDAEKMEAQERLILADLGVADPYGGRALVD